MLKVWFNHWFSTSYGLIELMKHDNKEEVYIIASNKQIDSVIQEVCDEWYQEPLLDGVEYIDYCIDFCIKHKIDIFVPRRKMVDISKNSERFREIGVKLLLDDYEKMELLNNKVSAYRILSKINSVNIPKFELVKNVDEFKLAYEKIKNECGQVCVKFVSDEGAMSYRRLVDKIEPYKRLHIYPGAEMEYQEYVKVLEELNGFEELMVMPYLAGPEISVDCLRTVDGLIAIPRYKSNSRHEEIVYDKKIIAMSRDVVNAIGLEFPCNVQYRLQDGIPYLLEVNTRMSGGLQMSCLASGINIPNIAMNKLIGNDISWQLTEKNCVVSYIEIPKIIR